MDAEITIHFEENAREAARAARMYGSMACMCRDWSEKDECDCGGANMTMESVSEAFSRAVTAAKHAGCKAVMDSLSPGEIADRERAGAAVTLGETNLNCAVESGDQCGVKADKAQRGFGSDPTPNPLGTGATTPPEGETKPHMNSDPENVPDVLDRLEYESKVLGIPADQLKKCLDLTSYRPRAEEVPENLFGEGDNDNPYTRRAGA